LNDPHFSRQTTFSLFAPPAHPPFSHCFFDFTCELPRSSLRSIDPLFGLRWWRNRNLLSDRTENVHPITPALRYAADQRLGVAYRSTSGRGDLLSAMFFFYSFTFACLAPRRGLLRFPPASVLPPVPSSLGIFLLLRRRFLSVFPTIF